MKNEPVVSEKLSITVAGRTFSTTKKTTFAQDFYVMERLEEAGLDKIVEGLDPKGDMEKQAQTLLVAAYKSGKLFELMGGILTEEGQKWTKENAKERAELFENTEDPADKEQITAALAGTILGFFMSAGVLSNSSPKSSDVQSLKLVQEEQTERLRPRASIEERLIMERGMESSEPSPDTM